MYYVRLFVVALMGLIFAAETYAQFEAYEVVGGNYLPEVVESKNRGLYLQVRPVGERDTLWMWIQHSTKRVKPQYESARGMDVVVWCHPQKYPQKNHVMPHARDIAVQSVGVKSGGVREKYLIIVDTSRREVPAEEDIRHFLISIARSRDSQRIETP